ncbi:protein of unknown function [Methylocaldum szegediense]|uniref:Uncharacterized protein n=1 Tax=Methylocaldum szegediense TaxID=73780 RepID=A0ABM9HWA1_9GAMM|nr:protein of unknown function [Methylocaldum szegediense]
MPVYSLAELLRESGEEEVTTGTF